MFTLLHPSARPVRSQLYATVTKFGVAHTDWKFVGIISIAAYVIPFVFDLQLWGVPLPLWTGLLALAACIGFFNYVRIGRPPLWLNHVVTTFVEKFLFGPNLLRSSFAHQRRRGASGFTIRDK